MTDVTVVCTRFDELDGDPAHLAGCAVCRKHAALRAEIVHALREVPRPALSSNFETRLGRRLREAPAPRPTATGRTALRPWLERGFSLAPRWAMRLYWAGTGIAAASILARVAPVEPARGEVLMIVGLLITFGLQRAIGPWNLRRIMRASLRGADRM